MESLPGVFLSAVVPQLSEQGHAVGGYTPKYLMKGEGVASSSSSLLEMVSSSEKKEDPSDEDP